MALKLLVLAVIILIILLIYCYFNANYIVSKTYNINSDKVSKDYKIIFLSDIHYAAYQRKQVILKALEKINKLHPDIVILGGDIVEELTTKEEVQEIFEAVSKINTTLGIYYIYGNHDRLVEITNKELENIILNNGITILADTIIELEDINIVGREDSYNKKQKNLSKLIPDINTEKFTLIADHRPIEYKDIAKTDITRKIDLVISGHTHAGQAFPIAWYMKSHNIACYGEYNYDNEIKLIVSSGAGVGGLPLRSEQHCEYVILNIKSNTQ